MSEGWTRLLVLGRGAAAIADLVGAAESSLQITARSDVEATAEDVEAAEMLLAFRLPERLEGHYQNLRWIQSLGAGADGILCSTTLPAATPVTRVTRVFGERIAEWAALRCLALIQDLPRQLRQQQERQWRPYAPGVLHGQSALVLGTGEIGAVAARKLAALGVAVTGVNRSGGAVEGVPRVEPAGRLDELLPQADIVLLLLPLTAATSGLFDARRIALLKPGALFLNAGRGALVDEEALAAALADGRLGGAALDVFAEEPLPRSSPLWAMERVLISPHVAAVTSPAEAAGAFLENYRRWQKGLPFLGLVDRARGY